MKRSDPNWKRVSKVLDFILTQQVDVQVHGVHVVKREKKPRRKKVKIYEQLHLI